MVFIKNYTTPQFENLSNVAGSLLYDSSINVLKFNNASSYNNILLQTNELGNLTGSLNNVDLSGFLGINTVIPSVNQVEINSDNGKCLRLIYNDNTGTPANYSDITVNSSGAMTLAPSGSSLSVSSNASLNILAHNGIDLGLRLNSVLVTSSAAQLNYCNVTPGTSSASKALVVDASKDISGINSLGLTSLILGGSAITASAAEINTLTGVVAGTASASKAVILDATKDITGINTISTTGNMGINTASGDSAIEINHATGDIAKFMYNSVAGTTTAFQLTEAGELIITPAGTAAAIDLHSDIKINGTLLTSTPTELNLLHSVTAGTASASKFVLLDSSKDIAGINSISLASITLGGTAITASAAEINTLTGATAGTALASKALIVDASKNISGINSLSLASITLGGTAITASAAEINTLTGVIAGSVSASKALIVDASSNLSGLGSLSLSSLTLGGTAITSTAAELNLLHGITEGTVSASKFVLVDSGRNISNINKINTTGNIGINTIASDFGCEINESSGNILRLTYNDSNGLINGLESHADFQLSGTGLLTITPNGPLTGSDLSVNISTHNGGTAGLKLGGTLVTSSAAELNLLDGVSPGVTMGGKAVITDNDKNITGVNGLTAAYGVFADIGASDSDVTHPLDLVTYPYDDLTPGVGIGSGVTFSTLNALKNKFTGGAIDYVTTVVTDNEEKGFFDFILTNGKIGNARVSNHCMTISSEGIVSSGGFVETSDIRVKENIKETVFKQSLDKILELDVKTYNFIYDDKKIEHTGLIAQELIKVLPSTVEIGKRGDIDDFHGVRYAELVPHLINCIKEFKNEIDNLKNEIVELKK